MKRKLTNGEVAMACVAVWLMYLAAMYILLIAFDVELNQQIFFEDGSGVFRFSYCLPWWICGEDLNLDYLQGMSA